MVGRTEIRKNFLISHTDCFHIQPTTSHLERASALKIAIITRFFIFPVCSLCNEVYIKLSEQDTFIMKTKFRGV